MRFSLIFFFLNCANFLFGQTDSIPKVLSLKNSLIFSVFPTIETGVEYKYRFKKSWFIAGVNLFTYRDRFQDIPIPYPDAINDSSLVWNWGINKKESQYEYKIGYETKIRFLKEITKPIIITKVGINFTYGKYTLNSNYGTNYIKYSTDSIGQTFYLDASNNPVPDKENAEVYELLKAESNWKYNMWSILPYLSMDFTAKKLPLSFGVRYTERIQFLNETHSFVDDPLQKLDVPQKRFFKIYPMMYLTLGMYF